MQDFLAMASASELVGLSVYAKAVLQRASEDDPNVVALRVACAFDTSGLLVTTTGELVDEQGNAVGGFSL